MNQHLCHALALVMLPAFVGIACKRNDAASSGSRTKFLEFNSTHPQCGYRYLDRPQGVKICMKNNEGGQALPEQTVQQAGDMAKQAIEKWIDGLGKNYPQVIGTKVTILYAPNCDDSVFQEINAIPGSGRSSSGPGAPMTLYTGNMTLGVLMHEFGHSFACLSDTYSQQTAKAGDCIPGQPASVMCWAGYDGRTDLYQDDVDGITSNYEKYGKNSDEDVTPPTHSNRDLAQGTATDATRYPYQQGGYGQGAGYGQQGYGNDQGFGYGQGYYYDPNFNSYPVQPGTGNSRSTSGQQGIIYPVSGPNTR